LIYNKEKAVAVRVEVVSVEQNCIYCGKPLADNEVCDCPESAAQSHTPPPVIDPVEAPAPGPFPEATPLQPEDQNLAAPENYAQAAPTQPPQGWAPPQGYVPYPPQPPYPYAYPPQFYKRRPSQAGKKIKSFFQAYGYFFKDPLAMGKAIAAKASYGRSFFYIMLMALVTGVFGLLGDMGPRTYVTAVVLVWFTAIILATFLMLYSKVFKLQIPFKNAFGITAAMTVPPALGLAVTSILGYIAEYAYASLIFETIIVALLLTAFISSALILYGTVRELYQKVKYQSATFWTVNLAVITTVTILFAAVSVLTGY